MHKLPSGPLAPGRLIHEMKSPVMQGRVWLAGKGPKEDPEIEVFQPPDEKQKRQDNWRSFQKYSFQSVKKYDVLQQV